jgi:hypothetical protein
MTFALSSIDHDSSAAEKLGKPEFSLQRVPRHFRGSGGVV